ncbi:MAG: hypothetical protein A3J79_01185 [Elusimicrobia bacterium RIFOXYB2_FULL_62_6]|nr:MAG: hypothetical protein A3J79_01185 [Elusimicrobia bacterium RIFOXYB2_FULL_62_6]
MGGETMKKGLLVCLVCALAWFFVFAGIDWGVPSSARMSLVMDERLKNDAFYDSLVAARNLVYKDTKNVLFAAPSRRTDEFAAKDRIVVDYKKDGVTFYFSNYMRHYFLCSHDPDENMVFNALSNMHPAKLDFNPHFFVYGGGFLYPLGAYYKALSLAGALVLVPDMKHYFRNPDDMGRMYLSGRVLAAVLGTLGILLLVLFEFNRSGTFFWPAALALMCFTSPILILWSKITKPHFYVLPFVMLCVVAVHRFLETKDKRWFRRAMALCGVVAGIALTTGLFAALPLMAYFYIARETRPPLKVVAKDLALGVLLAALALVLLNPYYVLSPKELLADLSWISATVHVSGGLVSIWHFFRFGLGLGPSLLFLAAVCAALLRRKTAGASNWMLLGLILLVSPIVYRLPNLPADIRWTTFILPLCFFFTVELLRRQQVPQTWLKALVLACALAGFADALRVRTYCVNDSREATSTRMQAGKWINENTGGAGIGHLYDIIPWTFPPVRLAEHRLTVYGGIEELFKDAERPEYFVQGDIERYALTKEHEKRLYELYRLEKEFHNSVRLVDITSTLVPANGSIYVYKRL